MSDTDIRGFGESPAQAKQPHKILYRLSLVECWKDGGTFKNYKAAYLYGISKWGSGALCQTCIDVNAGWIITEVKT